MNEQTGSVASYTQLGEEGVTRAGELELVLPSLAFTFRVRLLQQWLLPHSGNIVASTRPRSRQNVSHTTRQIEANGSIDYIIISMTELATFQRLIIVYAFKNLHR